MTKLTVLDQMQRTLEFIQTYAEKHPEFRQELEAALAAPVTKKPKPATPHEYVAEHGLPEFKTHIEAADQDTLMSYARRLKLKVPRSKNPPLEELRRSIVESMEAQLDKGAVFAQHS